MIEIFFLDAREEKNSDHISTENQLLVPMVFHRIVRMYRIIYACNVCTTELFSEISVRHGGLCFHRVCREREKREGERESRDKLFINLL